MTKHLQPKLASGGRMDKPTEAQIPEEIWLVKREPQSAKLQPKPHPHRAQQRGDPPWQKEWGGEHAAHRYFATAAADMLRKRLGRDLGLFLDLVDKTDPEMIFDLLREAAAAEEAASASASVVNGDEAEPPLPFMNAAG
jgi:hypothetical protein